MVNNHFFDSPVDVFVLFFDKGIVERIHFETNLQYIGHKKESEETFQKRSY